MIRNFVRTTALAAVALAFAGSASAGIVYSTDTFEGGQNPSGWTYGPPPNLQSSGGNPGWYLRSSVDTFAPMLRTSTTNGEFFGDYRATRVETIGVDLRTFSTQFSFQREASLVLWSGTCAVYRLGTDFVPQSAEGWKSIDIPVPSQSATLPTGWSVHPSSTCQSPNPTWNQVITNVTKVEFFYGHPEFFFIFDIWNVGADNVRIGRQDDFTNLGSGLAGTTGEPLLTGSGVVAPGSLVSIDLSNTVSSSTAFLMTGLAPLNLPFLGGTLVPNVATTNIVVPLATDAQGAIPLTFPWPNNIPSGTAIYLQYWIADPGGPFGVAASNGLRIDVP
jgi:hypothetical protein